MKKIKRIAVFTKRLHQHFAPSGFVTSFDIAIDEINFFDTIELAEKFIDEQEGSQQSFWTIEEVYILASNKPE